METLNPLPPPTPPIILIVEDDIDTRDMYHMALTFDGYWVVDAPEAGQALDCVAELSPDVIVTDIGLAGDRDGMALAEQLRADARTAGIPLLAVTGRDPRSLGKRALLFDAVLLKPVAPDFLSAKIRSTLERAEELRQRSEAARQSVPRLLQKSAAILARSRAVVAKFTNGPRRCPKCDSPLTWSDRRTLHGVTFDYYHPCASGCGLFCYNHSDRRFQPLTD